MVSMQTIDSDQAGDFDRYYVERTSVHKLLVTDDEIRFPGGEIVDDESGTLTLEEYRAIG